MVSLSIYGKIVASDVGNGTLSIPLSGVAERTYTLRIFSKKVGGENNTDFCSTLLNMTLMVDSGMGTVSNIDTEITVLFDVASLTLVAGQAISTVGD